MGSDYMYHAWLEMGSGRTHHWRNKSKEYIITEVLVPFVERQVIEAYYRNRPTLLNLSGAHVLRIFRSPRKIEPGELEEVLENKIPDVRECTRELIVETRLGKAHETAKSLIQKLFLPIKKQIFVIMKFDNPLLDSAYKGVIRPLGEEFGYRVIRIDDIEDSGKITDQILNSIVESEIVLAELSCQPPNCYYETGFAHAIGREVILTIQKNEPKHFDLAEYRFIEWETEDELRKKMRSRLKAIAER